MNKHEQKLIVAKFLGFVFLLILIIMFLYAVNLGCTRNVNLKDGYVTVFNCPEIDLVIKSDLVLHEKDMLKICKCYAVAKKMYIKMYRLKYKAPITVHYLSEPEFKKEEHVKNEGAFARCSPLNISGDIFIDIRGTWYRHSNIVGPTLHSKDPLAIKFVHELYHIWGGCNHDHKTANDFADEVWKSKEW